MRNPWLLLVGTLLVAAACGGNDENNSGTADAAEKDGPLRMDAKTADAGPGGTANARTGGPLVNDAGQALCQSGSGLVVCQCSDGKDKDNDMRADSADPECTGPQDDDESSFATGIPGDNSDPYVLDCFFDGDSGGDNDGCRWDIRCESPPNGQHCNNNQLAGCGECRPLTPNGCDCFGCCDVYVNGVPHIVRIIEGCTAAVINDPSKCPTCTKVQECNNPCDPCEVCIGRPNPDPSCQNDAGPAGMCPAGSG
jgi:hypothetical protein